VSKQEAIILITVRRRAHHERGKLRTSNWTHSTATYQSLRITISVKQLVEIMRARNSFVILTILVVVAITSIGAIPSFVTGALAVGGTCMVAKMILVKVVTTGDECLIERLGKFDRKIGPGWNLVVRPIEKVSAQTTLREQVLDILPQQCYTLDK
jgi:hypothetical protein